MKNIFTIIVLALFATSSFAQEKGSPNIVGINHSINSNILKENKTIQVYLPKEYATTTKKYPVIYLLDGQRFFLYGASLLQSFTAFDLTPDFIVVGITNQQSTRMNTFSAKAKGFAEYLEKEVIPLINSSYRTSKKRLLFGWAYGGGFGIETLISKPHLFDGYILSSPYPVSSKMKKFKAFIEQHKSLNTFVYFASDAKEFGVKEGTEELATFLNLNTTNLRWKFKVLSGEEHRSTVYPTLYHGIQEYFEAYREIQFKDLNEFITKGGIPYVKKYYSKRSKLYNLPNKIAPFTKYIMLRTAMRADNFAHFDEMYSTFGSDELLKVIRVSRACEVADFYIKNNKKQKALKLYQFITKAFPTSKKAQNGLSNLLKK
jgi:predicted alpha/beta superfamily hydrolase